MIMRGRIKLCSFERHLKKVSQTTPMLAHALFKPNYTTALLSLRSRSNTHTLKHTHRELYSTAGARENASESEIRQAPQAESLSSILSSTLGPVMSSPCTHLPSFYLRAAGYFRQREIKKQCSGQQQRERLRLWQREKAWLRGKRAKREQLGNSGEKGNGSIQLFSNGALVVSLSAWENHTVAITDINTKSFHWDATHKSSAIEPVIQATHRLTIWKDVGLRLPMGNIRKPTQISD